MGLEPTVWIYQSDSSGVAKMFQTLEEAVAQEAYPEALVALQWLLRQAPDSHPLVYHMGRKVYETIADQHDDLEIKHAYLDSALWCFDQQVYYWCDEGGEVRDRQAFYTFKYYNREGTQYPRIWEAFQLAHQLRGQQLSSVNLVPYFTTATRMFDPLGQVTQEELVTLNNQLLAILQYQQETRILTPEKADQIRSQLEGIGPMVEPMDSTFMEDNFCSKFAQDPSDIDLAKKVVSNSLAHQITNTTCFLSALIRVNQAEPSIKKAQLLADTYVDRATQHQNNLRLYYGLIIAAHGWYQKAGDGEGVEQMVSALPTQKQLDDLGVSVGETFSLEECSQETIQWRIHE